nr:hypothetical protein B0A51_14320 [Rachicladosporium sp. CCFEE 5018]
MAFLLDDGSQPVIFLVHSLDEDVGHLYVTLLHELGPASGVGGIWPTVFITRRHRAQKAATRQQSAHSGGFNGALLKFFLARHSALVGNVTTGKLLNRSKGPNSQPFRIDSDARLDLVWNLARSLASLVLGVTVFDINDLEYKPTHRPDIRLLALDSEDEPSRRINDLLRSPKRRRRDIGEGLFFSSASQPRYLPDLVRSDAGVLWLQALASSDVVTQEFYALIRQAVDTHAISPEMNRTRFLEDLITRLPEHYGTAKSAGDAVEELLDLVNVSTSAQLKNGTDTQMLAQLALTLIWGESITESSSRRRLTLSDGGHHYGGASDFLRSYRGLVGSSDINVAVDLTKPHHRYTGDSIRSADASSWFNTSALRTVYIKEHGVDALITQFLVTNATLLEHKPMSYMDQVIDFLRLPIATSPLHIYANAPYISRLWEMLSNGEIGMFNRASASQRVYIEGHGSDTLNRLLPMTNATLIEHKRTSYDDQVIDFSRLQIATSPLHIHANNLYISRLWKAISSGVTDTFYQRYVGIPRWLRTSAKDPETLLPSKARFDFRDSMHWYYESQIKAALRSNVTCASERALGEDAIDFVAHELAWVPSDLLVISSKVELPLLDRLKYWIECIMGESWYWWPLASPVHPLRWGYERVSWTYPCGGSDHVDIPVDSANALRNLFDTKLLFLQLLDPLDRYTWYTGTEREIVTAATNPIPTSSTASSASSTPRTGTANAQSSNSSSSDRPSAGLNKLRVRSPSVGSGSTAPRHNTNAKRDPRYLYFCVEVDFLGSAFRYPVIETHILDHDPHFFGKLKEEYLRTRGWLRETFSWWRYDHCDFYRFQKFASHLSEPVANDFPADTDTDYDFQPSPLKPPHFRPPHGPILKSEYRHRYYSSCTSCHSWHILHQQRKNAYNQADTSRLKVLPKRKAPVDMTDSESEVFWGIIARERRGFAWVLAYASLANTPGVLFFFLWLFQWGHASDLQNAAIPLTISMCLTLTFATVLYEDRRGDARVR